VFTFVSVKVAILWNLRWWFLTLCAYVDSGQKQMYGLFFPTSKKAAVYVIDTVRTNQMPNMTNLYNAEHVAKLVMSFFWLFTATCIELTCCCLYLARGNHLVNVNFVYNNNNNNNKGCSIYTAP